MSVAVQIPSAPTPSITPGTEEVPCLPIQNNDYVNKLLLLAVNWHQSMSVIELLDNWQLTYLNIHCMVFYSAHDSNLYYMMIDWINIILR